MAASWSWWEALRVQHHLVVEAWTLTYERRDRRNGETTLQRWSHAAFLREPPQLPILDEVVSLLADPDQEPELRRERARQHDWVRRWRQVPLDPSLPELARPRHLQRLDRQDFTAVLRSSDALLQAHPPPMRLQGPAGERTLASPYHFAQAGFVQGGRFVLAQHGQVFVLDSRGDVLASSFGMGGWGIGAAFTLLPLRCTGEALICRLEDPRSPDRHPALAELLGPRSLLRWDLAEGLLGRWPEGSKTPAG